MTSDPKDAWQINLNQLTNLLEPTLPSWVQKVLSEGRIEPYFATRMLSIYSKGGKVKISEGDYLILNHNGSLSGLKKDQYEVR